MNLFWDACYINIPYIVVTLIPLVIILIALFAKWFGAEVSFSPKIFIIVIILGVITGQKIYRTFNLLDYGMKALQEAEEIKEDSSLTEEEKNDRLDGLQNEAQSTLDDKAEHINDNILNNTTIVVE